MKILLLISSFNSLSQKVFVKLKEDGHKVSIKFAIDSKLVIDEVKNFEPDLILCPYLKEYIAKEVFENYPTFIIHPGVIGDRGNNSLDIAIMKEFEMWGVVVLKANEEFDAGDIYSQINFKMPKSSKANIYRNEATSASMDALDELLCNLANPDFVPKKQILNPIHKNLTQDDRKIDWNNDSTQTIIKKIDASDSTPGVKDEILGLECYLFGVHEEDTLKSSIPKQILAKRDGAICLSTIDGAVWISHLKEKNRFKLPSTYVLKERLKGIKEERIPLIIDEGSRKTFYEISSKVDGDIAYLYFDFHNGAMNANQCVRLKYAIEYLKDRCKVLVLMGGKNFFSNGIELNILEDSKKQGEDGWSNINAINDLVKSILFAEDIITLCAFDKNAGAGGVFLGLACDYVLANSNVVLNPHYKTLGLSGSEYHTFILPKRIGNELSNKLLNDCLPIGAKKALNIGMIDKVFDAKIFQNELEKFCKNLVSNEDIFDEMIDNKRDYLEINSDKIDKCKEAELKIMYDEFWNEESSFHKLRYDFVYKIPPKNTPKRLKDIVDA